jgi:hypothetical protein
MLMLSIFYVQMKQFRKQLKLVSQNLRVDITFSCSSILLPTPFLPSFHALSSDVQGRPRCRDDRIPGYDHHDFHLGLCDP